LKFHVVGQAGYIGSALSTYLPKFAHTLTDFNSAEVIINAAGRAVGASTGLLGLERQIQANVKLNTELCYRAMSDGTRIVYLSSAYVYPFSSDKPTPESAELGPATPYGQVKALGEAALKPAVETGLAAILRLSHVYGGYYATPPKLDSVVTRWVDLALQDKPLPIQPPDWRYLDLVHLSDVCSAVASVLSVPGVFNIGSGNAKLLYEVAWDVIIAISSKSKVEPVSSRGLGPEPSTFLNISKAQKALRWSPFIKFDQGVKSMAKQ